MSKYIIELEDDIQYLIINGRADNRCYTLVRPVAELEVLNSDYINEHFGSLQDEAYQRGFEDGKKSGYEKGLNAVGTYRKGYAIGYDEGYEDGKNSYDKNKTYQRGLEDAWETARALVWDTSISEYETAGVKVESWDGETCEVLRRYPAHEAVELLRTINSIGQPKLDFQSDIECFVKNANEAITELAKRFAENIKDMYK